MIICLSTTTALARSYVIDSLRIDDVNRAAVVYDYTAGKNSNVARVLTTLGERAVATGFLGGDRGQAVRRELDSAGVVHSFIDAAATTRLCVTVIDRTARTATELVEEPQPVTAGEVDRLLEHLQSLLATAKRAAKSGAPSMTTVRSIAAAGDAGDPLAMSTINAPGADASSPAAPLSHRPNTSATHAVNRPPLLVLSGSLAPGVPVDFYRQCVQLATAAGVRTIVDATGEPLRQSLAARPFVVKPNRSELAATVGRAVESEADLRGAIQQLIAAGPTWAAVTMGHNGAIVSDGDTFHRLVAPKIEPVSAVGSGDSFAAGLVAGIVRGDSVPAAARLAVACGAANALTERSGHVSLDDIDRLLKETHLLA